MRARASPQFEKPVKEANKMSRNEWLDLAQQVWFMYPEDVKREEGHPAPFPEKLPARLMRLYTYGQCDGFEGELIVDPFVGTGTTCIVANKMKRRWIGIDISKNYLEFAEKRIKDSPPNEPLWVVGRAKYPTKDELVRLLFEEGGSKGAEAVSKHKRKAYGRKAEKADETDQPKLM